jgi:hypothetical protein
MKAWLLVNWKPIARVIAVIAMYVLAKWFPLAVKEREAIETIIEVVGLGVVGLLPGLRMARRETDE